MIPEDTWESRTTAAGASSSSTSIISASISIPLCGECATPAAFSGAGECATPASFSIPAIHLLFRAYFLVLGFSFFFSLAKRETTYF